MNRMVLHDEEGHKRTLCNCRYQKIERGKYKVYNDRFRIGMIIVGDNPSEITCEKTEDTVDANITIDSAGTYNIKDSFGKIICTIKVNTESSEVQQDDQDGMLLKALMTNLSELNVSVEDVKVTDETVDETTNENTNEHTDETTYENTDENTNTNDTTNTDENTNENTNENANEDKGAHQTDL